MHQFFSHHRSLFGLSIFFLSIFIFLQGLGFWQLWRLEWKEALLDRIETRRSMPPVSLQEALRGEDLIWRRVLLRGVFSHDFERHILTSVDGGAGWRIITPLFVAMEGGEDMMVLVDRGVVPSNLKLRGRRIEVLRDFRILDSETGTVSLTGFILPPQMRGFFSPSADISANIWHWHDYDGMVLSLRDFFSGLNFAPFIVHAQKGFDGWGSDFLPRRDDPSAGLHNRHFGYAVTWFSLSLIALLFWYLLCFSRFRLDVLRAK